MERVQGCDRDTGAERLVAFAQPVGVGGSDDDPVVTGPVGGSLLRGNVRRRVWLPALDAAGITGGLRFHDLRHCYATWLVSRGVPVNVVQQLMGHERSSTTLDLYTHAPTDYFEQVRDALADFLLTDGTDDDDEEENPSAEGS